MKLYRTKITQLLDTHEVHYRLLPLMRANFLETNPVPVKTAMEILGRCHGGLRSPLGPPAPGTGEKLMEALRSAGLEPAR